MEIKKLRILLLFVLLLLGISTYAENYPYRADCLWLTVPDHVCPPTTSYIVWNLITAPKESLVTPVNEHWTSDDTNYGQMLWLKKHIQ